VYGEGGGVATGGVFGEAWFVEGVDGVLGCVEVGRVVVVVV